MCSSYTTSNICNDQSGECIWNSKIGQCQGAITSANNVDINCKMHFEKYVCESYADCKFNEGMKIFFRGLLCLSLFCFPGYSWHRTCHLRFFFLDSFVFVIHTHTHTRTRTHSHTHTHTHTHTHIYIYIYIYILNFIYISNNHNVWVIFFYRRLSFINPHKSFTIS